MSEKLLSRREESSDRIKDLEQSKSFQARQTLLKYGILKKVNDLELYHGRAGDGGNSWSVDPSYNNSSNNTGNYNINKRPALNTARKDVAKEFSVARASHEYEKSPEVYRIVSPDPDATILDFQGYGALDSEQQKEVCKAFWATLPKTSHGSPISFNDRGVLDRLTEKDFTTATGGLIHSKDLKTIQEQSGYSESVVKNVSSALNTMLLIINGRGAKVCNSLLVDGENEIGDPTVNDTVPLSQEYLSSWFKLNHIVGYRIDVNSATLGFKQIDNYLIYDLEKVNTPETIQNNNRETYRRFGRLANDMYNKFYFTRSDLAKTLGKNLYIQPDRIVDMAKEVPRGNGATFKPFFEADAGNHEGYTVGEHTETVLRLFDNNYADNLPADIVPFMRMALLVHDIGKGAAVWHHQKQYQKAYNEKYAREFLEINNIDPKTTNLIISMIGEGATITARALVFGEEGSRRELDRYCAKRMAEYFGPDEVTEGDIDGFRLLCEILQTCDSAAYTDMAVTRRGKKFFKNEAVFNDSFKSYHGFDGHTARLKTVG